MKLQIGRASGAQFVPFALAIVALCLFEFVLHRQSGIFREYAAAFLSLQWMLLASFAIWCGTFLFLTFSWKDLPLMGLLLIALVLYFIGTAERSETDALVFLFGVALGKGTGLLLKAESGNQTTNHSIGGDAVTSLLSKPEKLGMGNQLETPHTYFVLGLVALLALASWWHLDMSNNFYSGPRWMGLWDNPNIYGMLMGVGGALAIGLLAANAKLKIENSKTNWFLGIAVFMLGVGLVMSYSRGAWLGAAIGLLYLAWAYGKLKWRYVLPVAAVAAVVVLFLWGSTLDSAPWYVKRADLGRPSVQNRATAWRAGLEIMRDHPLGVGWNNAVRIYGEKYSPPEGGPGALTTNDYLMLGTELGIPALLCFVAYVGLCLRGKGRMQNEECRIQTACRAGAVVLLVAFWFDGGLFNLPTAAVFWVLLELGVERTESRKQKAEINLTKAESGKAESGKLKPAEYLAAKEHKEHIDTDSSPHPSPRLARRGRNFLRSLRSFVAIKSAIENRQSAIDQSLVTSAATEKS